MTLTNNNSSSRSKLVALTIVALVIIGILIFYNNQPDLNKMEALYNRGQFHAARVGLEQALQKAPERHEARTLLVHTELSDGKPLQALEQMLILAEAKWDTLSVEVAFRRWMRSEQLDEDTAMLIIDFVYQESDRIPQWEWLREVGVDVVRANLPPSPILTSHYSWVPGMEFRAWLLDNVNPDSSFWTKLQAKFPQDSLAAVGRARSMSSPQGLEWLSQWESSNEIYSVEAGLYSLKKSSILHGMDTMETAYLNHVFPQDLLAIALAAVDNRVKLVFLLDYLEQYPDMGDLLEVARQAVDAPEPEWRIPAGVISNLTEDGNKIVLRKDDKIILHEIATGQRVELPAAGFAPFISPDGSKVAQLETSYDGWIAHIFTDQGVKVQEYKTDNWMYSVGWKDSSNLWLTKHERTYPEQNLFVLNLATEKVSRFEAIPPAEEYAQMRVGPGGRLAWFSEEKVGVWDGQEFWEYEYQADISGLDWAPDGSRIALTMGKDLYVQDIGGEFAALDLSGEHDNYYRPFLSWRNGDELYINYPLGRAVQMLAIYNLKTREITQTGIVNPQEVAGNRVLLFSGDTARIYDFR